MDLNALRAFLAVAETGSFAAAAKLTETPRASLRRRVDELEGLAGTALLHRTPSGALLTDAGEALALKARTILEQTSALLRSLRDIGSEPAGTLRLMLPVGLPPAMVVAIYALLRSTLPDLRYHTTFACDPSAERLDELDMVTHFGERALGERWATLRLLTLREWLVASPDYLERHGRPTSVEELARHTLLSWQAPGRPPGRWPTLDEGSIGVDPVMVSPDVHLVRHLAAAGHGIALVPDGEVPDPHLPEEALEPVLADRVGAVIPLCLSFPVVLQEVPRVRRVLDLVRQFTGAI